MLKLTVTITGRTAEDLAACLAGVAEQIARGSTHGTDANPEDGSMTYTVETPPYPERSELEGAFWQHVENSIEGYRARLSLLLSTLTDGQLRTVLGVMGVGPEDVT